MIADGQFLITEALKSMLQASGFRVVAVSRKHELQELLGKQDIALLIIDPVRFEYGSTGELAWLKRLYPATSILILTGSISKQQVIELNREGIGNIAMKTDELTEILHAVREALNGRKHYSRELFDLLVKSGGQTAESLLLTPSEIEIVRMLSGGLSIKEIALRKNVTVSTVTTYRKNIYRKLNVSSRSELVRYAIETGLVDAIDYYI